MPIQEVSFSSLFLSPVGTTMAAFSSNQLYSLSSPFSANPRPRNPNSTGSLLIKCKIPTLSSASSAPRGLIRASLGSSPATTAAPVLERESTLREICDGHVPDHILRRAEEVGFVMPTDVQQQALPIMLSGRDCILHAQTGSGKTLAYLLSIYSVINTKRSVVQALIVVPTRELGMQVTKVARLLAAKPSEPGIVECSVMALLDGGMLIRQKSWLKAEPPTIVVATLRSLCQMLEKKKLNLESLQVLVVDEVDFMFNSSKDVSLLRKLLTSYSSCNKRQTILASASIPQHRRFMHDCIQQKWTKGDVFHVHVNSVNPMPSRLHHRYLVCGKSERHQALLSLLSRDAPQSAIIFVNEQSEKSKKAGQVSSTLLLVELLKASDTGCSDLLLLEEDMNYNSRAASLSEMRRGGSYVLVATDIASRGVDLPETTHIYNFDVPKTAVDYLHRAGRTGRRPFSDDDKCIVTSILTSEEKFVLQRFQNELMFQCTELSL